MKEANEKVSSMSFIDTHFYIWKILSTYVGVIKISSSCQYSFYNVRILKLNQIQVDLSYKLEAAHENTFLVLFISFKDDNNNDRSTAEAIFMTLSSVPPCSRMTVRYFSSTCENQSIMMKSIAFV